MSTTASIASMSSYHSTSSTPFGDEPTHHEECWDVAKSELGSDNNKDTSSDYASAENEALLEQPRLELRTSSQEFFNPPAESHLRRSSLFVATFNMVATIIGGGILSIPLSFQKTGLVLGTILTILAAVTTAFSLYILCSCSRRSGASSYGGVARVAFGPGLELFTTVLLFVFLAFVSVAYMVLVKNIWTPIVMTAARHFSNNPYSAAIASESDNTATPVHDADVHNNLQDWENAVLLGILVLVSPFLLKRDLHALRHNCYVGFVSITILCVAMIYRAYERNAAEGASLFTNNVMWCTSSFADALFAYPIITLAFLCSFNIISVHGALVNPTRERVREVINKAVMASFGLTYIFGLAGYLYAYNDTQGNILLNFDASDPLIFTGRIGCGITCKLAPPPPFDKM
jgi:amino acid permease